jgi:plastocyanin domain-containing protein
MEMQYERMRLPRVIRKLSHDQQPSPNLDEAAKLQRLLTILIESSFSEIIGVDLLGFYQSWFLSLDIKAC